jgi:hypothetical protein
MLIKSRWMHAGLHCVVILHGEPGHHCGYVRVPPGHPLYGKDRYSPEVRAVPVHGGVTYSQDNLGVPGEENEWWFGFDTIHVPEDAFIDPDIDPTKLSAAALENWNFFRRLSYFSRGHYWSLAEVIRETDLLAEVLSL